MYVNNKLESITGTHQDGRTFDATEGWYSYGGRVFQFENLSLGEARKLVKSHMQGNKQDEILLETYDGRVFLVVTSADISRELRKGDVIEGVAGVVKYVQRESTRTTRRNVLAATAVISGILLLVGTSVSNGIHYDALVAAGVDPHSASAGLVDIRQAMDGNGAAYDAVMAAAPTGKAALAQFLGMLGTIGGSIGAWFSRQNNTGPVPEIDKALLQAPIVDTWS